MSARLSTGGTSKEEEREYCGVFRIGHSEARLLEFKYSLSQ